MNYMGLRKTIAKAMVDLSRIDFVKFVVQKLGLLTPLARLYAKLRPVSDSQPEENLFFLGETLISRKTWSERLLEIRPACSSEELAPFDLQKLPDVPSGSGPLCSVLSSIYQPGPHLVPFLRNLAHQSIFEDIDIILIGVSLDDNETAILTEFAELNDNVNLILTEERISIYAAWNMGLQGAKSTKITNMNVDDFRHFQSLEIQVRELDAEPSVSVVYQDVFYVYEYIDNWNLIEGMGVRSQLPSVSTSILARGINAPHNGPMWRTAVHESVGLFDETFLSAGDHDLWIRASIAGATFKKSDFVHVSYFINPDGMSTKAESPGVVEGAKILERYSRYV